MHDQALDNNSLLVAVTETWLHDEIFDAEVSHNMPGYHILRCDRSGRVGGGVAIYLRDDLSGDILGTFDNGVCQLLLVHVHQLSTVVAVVYRPPDTRLEEFKPMLEKLDEILSDLQTPTPIISVMGDFNFTKEALRWERSEQGLLFPVIAKHRELETAGGKQDRLQANSLINMTSKHSLLQQVDQVTHAVEILDLMFTNDTDLVSCVQTEDWPLFTDHKLVTIDVTYRYEKSSDYLEQQYLCETGKRYRHLNFHLAPWEQIKVELERVEWDDMEQIANVDIAKALSIFHGKVLGVLEKLVPRKKKSQKKSKMKIHKIRRSM